jgi:hypothetical protein
MGARDVTATASAALLAQGFELLLRAKSLGLDRDVERALAATRGRCATFVAERRARYDADLEHWRAAVKKHLAGESG